MLSSPLGIFSTWFRLDNDNEARYIIKAKRQNPLPLVEFYVQFNGFGGMFVSLVELSTGAAFEVQTNTYIVTTTNSDMRHLLVSWDLTVPIVHLYLDDVNDIFTVYGPTSGSFEWNKINQVNIFTNYPSGGNWWHGCCSQIYLNTDEYLDFSIVSNRRFFNDGAGGLVPLGTNGELPTGNSPSFYFHGGPATFPINYGTGFTLDLVGTLIDCPPFAGPPWYFEQNIPGNGGNPQIIYDFENWVDLDPYMDPESYFAASVYKGTNGTVIRLENSSDVGNLPLLPWENVFTIGSGHQGGGALKYFDNTLFWAVNKTIGDDIEVYKTLDGDSFTLDTTIATGRHLFISSAAAEIAAYSYRLYMGTGPDVTTGDNSPQIWTRSVFGTWSLLHSFGSDRLSVTSIIQYGSDLYASVDGLVFGAFVVNDAQIWKSVDGFTWTLLHTFPGRHGIGGLEIFNGDLYAAVYSSQTDLPYTFNGREIWVTSYVDDTVWTLSHSFTGSVEGSILTNMVTDGELLYVGFGNDYFSGSIQPKEAQVWATPNGTDWFLSADFNTGTNVIFDYYVINFGDDPIPTGVDSNYTVTALGINYNNGKVYAATGDFAFRGLDGVNIFVTPTPDDHIFGG